MRIFDKWKRKKDLVNEIVAKLDCECSVITVEDVASVMKTYQQALKQGKQEGFTPLIVIPSQWLVEALDRSENRETILARAKEIDAEALFKRLLQDVMPDEDDDHDEIAGEFTPAEPIHQFHSVEEFINKKIIIANIPTEKPWEAAAWVPTGGFNECPLAEEQVVVFQYWYEKYQALPALVTSDVWELFVENPPTTQDEAESLAWEHFSFCPDIVFQGVGTVNELAGGLISSSVWFFWWD
jgi:hypothetical protein